MCEINCDLPALCAGDACWPARFRLQDHMGTKFYYENLPEPEDGGENDKSGIGNGCRGNKSKKGKGKQKTIDDHSTWKKADDLSEAEKQLVKNQIDTLAKNTAEQVMKQCGNIPGQFKEYIDSLFVVKPQIFNWKAYFRRVIGNMITSEILLTKMRPSRRFPDAKGIKMKRKPSVLVGVDTSGSVSNNELLDFFSEINHLWKSGVKVTIAEIDTRINRIYEYKGHFDGEINGRGGTSFEELWAYKDEHKKDFSTLVMFTDGFVDINNLNGRNVVWVLTSNHADREYPGVVIEIPKENK